MFTICRFIISFVLPTLLFAAEQDSSSVLLSRDEKGKPVAIHANRLLVSQFDSLREEKDLFEGTRPESIQFLDNFSDGTVTKNYMQASFFVVGDVRGSGTQLPYRTLPIGTDGKRIIWGSAQSSWPIEDMGDGSFVFSRGESGKGDNGGHSEPQFVTEMREVFIAEPTVSAMYRKLTRPSSDDIDSLLERLSVSQNPTEQNQAAKILHLKEIVRETLRTDPTQFSPFLRSGGNKKIRCYGFLLDSVFDICPPCLGELSSFIEDNGRCSLHDFMQQQRGQRRIDNCDRSRIVVNAAFPYIYTNYCLKTGNNEPIGCDRYSFKRDTRGGILKLQGNSNDIDVKWDFVEKDLSYPVVCRVRSFFRSPLETDPPSDLVSYKDFSPRFEKGCLTVRF